MKKSFLEITENDVDKKSRIKRLNDAVFKHGIIDINKMIDIPEKIRSNISLNFEIISLMEKERKTSQDGTTKFLFELHDGLLIESVFIIDKKNRVTLCISSQAGCRMGCVFCKTASLGFKRNLTEFEIVSQVIYIFNFMTFEKGMNERMFNIVYMGMGEPFDNYDNLVKSLNILTDKSYFYLHPSWITISTCGIMDKVEPILELFPRLRIAISLNCAIDSKRSSLMKITNSFPVKEIENTLKRVYQKYKQRITLEYVLIKDVNDTDDDIEALEVFNSKAFHINLIPLNDDFNGCLRPLDEEINAFRLRLSDRGFFTTVRIRRGGDIQADCGQLCLEKAI